MFHARGPTFFELARQALSSTERGYDLLAPKFDYTPFRTNDGLLELAADYVGRRFGKFDSALDVCCGTGAAMEAFGPLVKNRLTGIDRSRGMLDVAGKNLSAMDGIPDPDLVRGDALEMTFDREFDLAFSFGAFGHILPRDEKQFTSGIYRALREGGRFIFVTHEMPGVFSLPYWMARSFNGAMHIRNLILRPRFDMYYLTYLWPKIAPLLADCGFHTEAVGFADLVSGRAGEAGDPDSPGSSTFTIPLTSKHLRLFKLVIATR